LPLDITDDLGKFKDAFFKRFSEEDQYLDLSIMQTLQGPSENVRDYLNRLSDNNIFPSKCY